MASITQPEDSRVEAAIAAAAARVGSEQAAPIAAFVRRYYATVPEEDLRERDPADLYGAAMAHRKFAARRTAGEPLVRAYNPRLEHHGWESPHTVLEIVTDDMPFLVDSMRMLLNERAMPVRVFIHPQLRARRDPDGVLLEAPCTGSDADDVTAESFMQVQIARQTEPAVLDELVAATHAVLADVRAAVEDWQPMRARLAESIDALEAAPPQALREEVEEAVEFLRWVHDHHFTFLGFVEYDLVDGPDGEALSAVEGSALGLFRGKPGGVSESFAKLPREVRRLAREPRPLIITKANTRSTVHRPGHLDYLGVKRFDANGTPVGERRFLGLYTSSAYNQSPQTIPLLSRKIARVMERSGYRAGGHDGKNLLNVLETFPRDLLLQIDDEALLETGVKIVQLQERQRVRLFVHPDRYQRFVYCLAYVPRDRFNTQIRQRIQSFLGETLHGTVADFTVQITESVLARLYFVYRMHDPRLPDYDVAHMQARLEDMTHAWKDKLQVALFEHLGEERGPGLLRRYGNAFRADYRETYDPRVAVRDIEVMESLGERADAIAMSLYQPLEANDNPLRFKLFHNGTPIPLYTTLPMLENMGLQVEDEHPHRIDRAGTAPVWLHDFGMDHSEGQAFDVTPVTERFQEAFERVWHGDAENDRFNALVLRAGLDWREIAMLRACAKYLRQARATFSEDYMARTLLDNAAIARQLVDLFHLRFDPDDDAGRAGQDAANGAIDAALEAVPNLDEDRILRSFRALIMAMLRTSYYQAGPDGEAATHVSFKLDPEQVPELPEPRPKFEVFVYSPQVEGVHLRGGPIARGGLRWSDRREDFRTEILGLMKAQLVKNAVIVPTGSKGGFFPKRLPAGERDAILAEGVASYRTFIRALLDVTDNLDGATVVPPPRTVRHDGDDPYLVVAADKGTATFSDIANGIAGDYGFWLEDAFASGGSNGYDHKAMGITARGAWESVKRHFRELDHDVQSADFTVVGIGDMSGDVFGNGMLLSPHIRLVAAFNHLHVFIDPVPDAAASYAERKRLFERPRTSWDDYDRDLLSAGGGIWPRTAKSIPLSPEARAALGVDAAALPPNEVIRAILRAPVDLLWNGGIGTYIKGSTETDLEVGDRANDPVRVDADTLRCRVIGEGGNLGITQRGRVEFALHGGRVNTDAIDNSGGVDCSDHEVNVKILLNEAVRAGDLTGRQRNELLADMTEEVAALVLRNNYLQTQALSLAGAEAEAVRGTHTRFVQHLVATGELDRELEFLPGEEELADREARGLGYTAPELAVLLPYAKMELYPDLLTSDLPDDPYLQRELAAYFPQPLRERFPARIREHRLAREIVSTVLANEIVNRCGILYAFRLEEVTGASADAVARAYLIAREVLGMPALWAAVEALDNRVAASVQLAALTQTQRLMERVARWLLRNRPQPLDIEGDVTQFAPGAALLSKSLSDFLPGASRARLTEAAAGYEGDGLPGELAARLAALDEMFSLFDLVEIATADDLSLDEVAAIYFELSARLDVPWVRERIGALPHDNRWQMLARTALREDVYALLRVLVSDVIRRSAPGEDTASRIDGWLASNDAPLRRWQAVLDELRAHPRPDATVLSVAMRELRGLRQQGR